MTFISDYLSKNLDYQKKNIREWLDSKLNQPHKLIYSSVDIRCSGYKIAPIDANLFPAGFNNLSSPAIEYAKTILNQYFQDNYSETKNIVIIAESHTRNKFYIDNLLILKKIFSALNIKLSLATLEVDELQVYSSNDELVIFQPIKNLLAENNTIIVLNNDLSEGLPEFTNNSGLISLPPAQSGWFQRKKSKHASFYDEIADEFCQEFGIDKFYLTTSFQECGEVNFKTMKGLECIAIKVEKMLHNLRQKYQEYGIGQQPYIVVKSNSGTYGMAVMVVSSGEEIIEINKKGRNKMNIGKSGITTSNVIIQEGIETIQSYENLTAESMVYSIAGKPISLIYRLNSEKGSKANLNSTGMSFREIDNGEQNPEFYYHYLVTYLTNLALIKEITYYENLGEENVNKT